MTKILIVDDQYPDRELLKDTLETIHYEVDVSSSAKEALEKVKSKNYDIVITDLMMPEIDGLKLIKLIKENDADIEVIIMTAYATVNTAIEAIKLGAYDYMIKPLDKNKLTISIKNCLESKKLSKEVKVLQQKIFNMEKMNAISQFSSSIAHQLRNPLCTILSTATFLQEKNSDNLDLKNSLDLIIQASEHADKIIYNLLRTTDFNEIKLEKTSLKEVINQTVKLIEPNLVNRKISFSVSIDKDVIVLADFIYLQQCLLNLFMNSIEAISKEGFIKLEVYVRESTLPRRRVEDSLKNKQACIVIEDNGKGIPSNLLPEIFNPFFTTKPNGTGIGLFFVYQVIVSCFNGDISVTSEENKGTKILISLPLA